MTSDEPQTAQRRRTKIERERLDVLLVERELAPSRERARALIMAHEVRVDGKIVDKAGTLVPRAATCELVGPAAELRFVSRGGLKLERALSAFALNPHDLVCLDVGASTGGFTDVLLRLGARRVYAVDVGHGQLAWALQTDPRVVVMDRTNIRHLETLPEPIDCAVIDVSFISLRVVLPHVARLLRPNGWIVALIKPQFEAGRAEVSRGSGVISDPVVHRRVLRDLLAFITDQSPAAEAKWTGPRLAVRGIIPSPITGRDGNHEYLLWLVSHAPSDPEATQSSLGETEIEATVTQAFQK